MKMRVLAGMLIVIAFALAGCRTYEVREDRPYGEVGPAYDAPPPEGEWVPIKVTAKGGGAPPPNAVNQAQARLMAERAAKVIDTKYLSDGGVEVEMEIILGYEFRRIFQ